MFFNLPSSLLLLFATFLLLQTSPSYQLAPPTSCTSPPAWYFYDIVNHLATVNINVDPHLATSNSTTATNGTATVAPVQPPPVQFRYNANHTQLIDVVVREPVAHFYRSPFANIAGNVTLVVLTNSREHELRNEQQIYNLEQIYRSFQGVHLNNIRFILINSRDAFNPRWVWETRKRVSFEVYQELPSTPISGNLVAGGNGDIFVYDRCGLLTYYIPFPLSFIHTQQPILQAAILATYFDSPCKAFCSKLNATSSQNVTFERPAEATTASSIFESITVDAEVPSPSSSSVIVANQTATKTDTTTTTEASYNDMGQILMKFFNQILPHSTTNSTTNGTTTTTEQLVKVATNQSATVVEVASEVANRNVSNIIKAATTLPPTRTSPNVLDRLRSAQKKQAEITCNQNVCNEWSTERLLKARLCCLNSQPEEPEDIEAVAVPAAATNGNVISLTSNVESAVNGEEAANETTEVVNDGSFGCQLYAKGRCNRIMPIIKCCLRKVLSKYFDFTIRLREQQQRAQFGSKNAFLKDTSATSSSDGSGSKIKDSHTLEYPADYVLGINQQNDYFKQQHQKRVNRRVVANFGLRR